MFLNKTRYNYIKRGCSKIQSSKTKSDGNSLAINSKSLKDYMI